MAVHVAANGAVTSATAGMPRSSNWTASSKLPDEQLPQSPTAAMIAVAPSESRATSSGGAGKL